MKNEKRVVVITGATSGYGKAMAELFYENGDSVVAAARNPQKLKSLKEEMKNIDIFQIDVTDYSDWEKFYDFIVKEYGRIDILINNAGGGVSISDIESQSFEDIDKAIKLNLNSVIYGSKTFAGLMKKQRSGTIINISSVCSKHAWPEWSVYAAAKSGVLSFSKGLYVELQPYNVRVTCIIPGAASTGFQRNAGIGEVDACLKPADVAEAVFETCNLPQHVVVEELTVWGIDQIVVPL